MDLFRAGADLRVTCPECGRTATFNAGDMVNYFHKKGWRTDWCLVGKHFRCAGSSLSPGCGHVGAKISDHYRLDPPSPTTRGRDPLSRGG